MTMHDDLYSEESLRGVTDAAVRIADLALTFGRIARTGPCHPDGTPESDSDHTVMLGWLAPALADLINHRMGFPHYSVNLVASFALVHDASEVYAGDTCTVKITEDELAAKADREALATRRLYQEFRSSLPWFAGMVDTYEMQVSKEAQFVRAVDKLLPKMVHLVDKRIGLKKLGITRSDLLELFNRQRKQVMDNTKTGKQLVLGVYDVLCDRVLKEWDADEAANPPEPVAQPRERHWITLHMPSMQLNHDNCAHHREPTCPFSVAFEKCLRYGGWPSEIEAANAFGDVEIALDERGELIAKEN